MTATARVRVGILAPMPSELKAVRRTVELRPTRIGDVDALVGTVGDVEVIATTTGMGLPNATRAAERMVGIGVHHVLVSGIAGGIDPGLAIGDLVVPEVVMDLATKDQYRATALGEIAPASTIVCTNELLDYGVLGPLVADGVVAVDMETSAIAAVCEQRGKPWTAFRGISDRLIDDEIDRRIFGLAKQDGSPNVGALLRYLGANPLRMRLLAKLAREMTLSANAAARAAIAAVAHL